MPAGIGTGGEAPWFDARRLLRPRADARAGRRWRDQILPKSDVNISVPPTAWRLEPVGRSRPLHWSWELNLPPEPR